MRVISTFPEKREQMQLQAREKAVEFQRALQSIDEQEREEFARIEALIAQKQVYQQQPVVMNSSIYAHDS